MLATVANNLLIKTTEKEHFVLDQGAADGEAAELVVQTRGISQVTSVRIHVETFFWKLDMEFITELFSFS